MKFFNGRKKFIIYLLLVSFVITAFDIGVEEHALSRYVADPGSYITKQAFTTCENVHIFQVQESNLALGIIRGYKNNNRSQENNRCGMLLLFILTFLSGVFRFTQEIYGFYRHLFIRYRYVMITYMHDKDGRKRIFNC